ncbi:hypothetical protein Btru_063343 [Bulinus truncatus]|nr:hypothetical protein Btru_063343 [Bulinus truncatus]
MSSSLAILCEVITVKCLRLPVYFLMYSLIYTLACSMRVSSDMHDGNSAAIFQPDILPSHKTMSYKDMLLYIAMNIRCDVNSRVLHDLQTSRDLGQPRFHKSLTAGHHVVSPFPHHSHHLSVRGGIYGHHMSTLFKLLSLSSSQSERGNLTNANDSAELRSTVNPSSASRGKDDFMKPFLDQLLYFSSILDTQSHKFNTQPTNHSRLLRHYHKRASKASTDEKLLTELTLPGGKGLTPFLRRLFKFKNKSRGRWSGNFQRNLTEAQRQTWTNRSIHLLLNKLARLRRLCQVRVTSLFDRPASMKNKLGPSVLRALANKKSLSDHVTFRYGTSGSQYPEKSPMSPSVSDRLKEGRQYDGVRGGRRARQTKRSVKQKHKLDNDVPVYMEGYSTFDQMHNYNRVGRQNLPQPVSLSIVVHLNVDRGYDRDLQAVLLKETSAREFAPLKKFISPIGKFVKLKDDRPREILQAFCDDILLSNTTTVVHLVNPFYHSRSWSSAQYVSNLLSTLDIPVISWGPEYIGATDKRESDHLQLNISPTLHHQAAAILSVLRHYNWTDFSLVYTSDTGHDAFIAAVRILVIDMNSNSGQKGFNELKVSRPTYNELKVIRLTYNELKVARPTYNELKVSRPTNSELKVARPTNSELKVARPTNNELKVIRLTYNELKVSRPTYNELKVTRLTYTELKVSRPTNSELKVARPTNSELKVARPTNSELKVARPTNSELKVARPTNSELKVARPTNSELKVARPTNSELKVARSTTVN